MSYLQHKPITKKHNLLLSIRTKFSTNTPNNPTRFLNQIQKNTLPQIFQTIISSPSINKKQKFLKTLNYLPHSSTPNIIQLDQTINSTLPTLNNTYSLKKISNINFTVPTKLIKNILTSAIFFFKLNKSPIQNNTSFYYQKSILYSQPNPTKIIQQILIKFPNAKFQSNQNHNLKNINPINIYQLYKYFRKHITFQITNLKKKISIKIINNFFHKKINNFPKSTLEFLNKQKTYTQFRHTNHQNLD
ncbi:unnamed protein product [Penicillium salamii]|nr:unnamed protein product [Penicillium salamii]